MKESQASYQTNKQTIEQLTAELQSTRERCAQLEMLPQLSRLLNSSLDFECVKKKAMETAAQLLGCEASSLLLKNAETKLHFEVALGEKAEIVKSFQLNIGEGIAGWVAQHGEPLIVSDVRNDPRFYKNVDEAADFTTRNLICIPLKTKGKLVGVIQGINKKDGEFAEDDLALFQSLADQIVIALDNAHLYEELNEMYIQLAKALSGAIEKRDRYTGGHTQRVLEICLKMAEHLDLKPEEKRLLMLSAILHDIGKVGVNDAILNSTKALTDDEFAIIREHPAIGAEILAHIKQLNEIIPAIQHHHEYYDGSGYPKGLKGDDIPLIARIIAVADTFDAMITDRPYKKGMSKKEAIKEIEESAGTQFDPQVVAAFLKAVSNRDS